MMPDVVERLELEAAVLASWQRPPQALPRFP